MKNRKAIPMIAYLLLLFAVFSWANNLFSDNLSQIPYSQVVELFRQEQVKAFEIQDDVITMELHGTLNYIKNKAAAMDETTMETYHYYQSRDAYHVI